jgi:GcrA cell cycle regulator
MRGDRPVSRNEAAMRHQWTAERVTMLQLLWARGATAAAIAAELGGLSRSAVLGKICKLRRRAANLADAPQWRPRRRKADEPARQASRRSCECLLELTNTTCRWPIGRPGAAGFFFCGVPEADLARGLPYCAHHSRRAYRIPPKIVAKAKPKAAPTDTATTKKSRPRRRYVWRGRVRHAAARWR